MGAFGKGFGEFVGFTNHKKTAAEIVQNMYPDRPIEEKEQSNYSMYISGTETFIIGIDDSCDVVYFCSYELHGAGAKHD